MSKRKSKEIIVCYSITVPRQNYFGGHIDVYRARDGFSSNNLSAQHDTFVSECVWIIPGTYED